MTTCAFELLNVVYTCTRVRMCAFEVEPTLVSSTHVCKVFPFACVPIFLNVVHLDAGICENSCVCMFIFDNNFLPS